MTYVFVLLAVVAFITMSAWNGISVTSVDETSIRASIRAVYQDLRTRATGAVKDKAREELHDIVDDKLE